MLIVIPLVLAWGTQALAARHRAGEVIQTVMTAAMVPLMAATLLTVVASQTPQISSRLGTVVGVVPLYAAFLVVMAGLGLLVARCFRLDVPGKPRADLHRRDPQLPGRATAGTRAARPVRLRRLIVVSQTLVELVGMVLYVQLIPRLVPARTPHTTPSRI